MHRQDTEYVQDNTRYAIRVEDLTDEQKFICERFSSIVREVLTIVEASLNPEGRQYKAVRRMLNEKLYGGRQDFLEYFSKSETNV